MAMQTVSSQLLKPPKDLASWSFPLSQILEDYFNSLPEPSNIPYGEAALIIQNSVNAYVRRVEELYDETRFFNKKMTANSKENGTCTDKEKKQKKSLLGIGQFEVIDFDKEKGKSINLKGQDKKTFKLLHGCFSQLENYHSKVSIEVFDVQGEVIGKKYNFRCNHHMTQSGILVDEFNEKDFNFSKPIEACRLESSKSPQNITENRNELDFTFQNVSNFQENADSTMEETLTAGIQDDVSDDESESNFSDTQHSSTIPLEQESANEVDLLDSSRADSAESFETEKNTEEHVSSNNHVTSNESCSSTFSDVSREINSTIINLENVENEQILDSNNEINTENKTESENEVNIENKTESENEVNIENKTESENEVNIENKTESENEVNIENETESENIDGNSETVQNKIGSTLEGNSNKRKRSDEDDRDEDCRRQLRSKKLKEVNEKESSCKDSDKQLQPIPFEDGIPKRSLKSRKEFRLPCHINLLKRKPSKRKFTKNKKKMCKIMNNKTETRIRSEEAKKKTYTETSGLISTACSSNPLLSGMKKENNEEFQKLFEEIMSQHLQSSVHYEPVTTLTMDLLGFHPTYNKNDDSLDSLSERSSRLPFTSDILSSPCSSPVSSTCSADIANSPPPDPTSSNQNKSLQNSQKTAENIGKAIKDKIKKIYEELDILTDEDQKIAKWHEEIKPRLEAAERKPPFRIQDYESRIIKKLETNDRKLDFEEIIREEPASEVARYFSATLQLASTNNLNINPTNELKHSIELILVE